MTTQLAKQFGGWARSHLSAPTCKYAGIDTIRCHVLIPALRETVQWNHRDGCLIANDDARPGRAGHDG